MLEGSLEVVQGTAPSPFPRPRASAPICCCWDSGLSVRSREDVSSPPCGSCRPHTLSPLQLRHLLPCCPAARLRVPSLGVSLLLFLGAMFQRPSGKGVLSFNFWRKGVSLSVSLHAFTCSAAAPYTACCRKNPCCRASTTEPKQVLLSGQPTSPDTMHAREELPVETVPLKLQRAIRNTRTAAALARTWALQSEWAPGWYHAPDHTGLGERGPLAPELGE